MSAITDVYNTQGTPDEEDRRMFADKAALYNALRVSREQEPLPVDTAAQRRTAYEQWVREEVMPAARASWVVEVEQNSTTRRTLIETWNAANDAQRAAMIAAGQ